MATSEHKFQYLLPPGNDFKLVRLFKLWTILSLVLCLASVAVLFVNKQVRGDYLNWTIDFKGGTTIVLQAVEKENPANHVRLDPAKVRATLDQLGAHGSEVSEMSWKDESDKTIVGTRITTPRFGALTQEQRQASIAAVEQAFADRGLQKVSWSGDRLFVRSTQPLAEADVASALKPFELELKPTEAVQAKINATPNEDTGEYNASFAVYGLDRQYETALEKAFGNVDIQVKQSEGVGAKAGDKLRNDGIKALFYAMGLIMLYLAVRFDIRYAPGAIVALVHDALMVIGVFALTWTEVSLTSVAALLTVIGFSVNDTVVIFDRIRENIPKLKDKKIERIVEISLNEVLVRSILTSVILFATTLTMNIFGTGLVQNFAFAMNIGIVVGAYSSIFLAPPVFLAIHKRWYAHAPTRARRAAATAEP
jgi:preprotein translocase subunit SecF